MNWLCKLFGHKIRHSGDILYCERCGWARHNPTSRPAGIRDLSELNINVDKDWGGHSILNAVLDLVDDQKIFLGADDDYSIRYDSTNNDFRIRDEVNAVETNLPKNVAMDLSAHAARHEPGGADVADAYLAGESAGLREEHGRIFADELATGTASDGTITFATAFSSKPVVIAGTDSDIITPERDSMFGGLSGTADVDPLTTSDWDYRIYNGSGSVGDIWGTWMAIGS